MLERHGNITIAAGKVPGQYAVTHAVTGQVRHFESVEECRKFIGVEKAPGPRWDVVPLDEHGQPMAAATVLSAPDEAAAKRAARDWFHFTGVFRIKDMQVTPHKSL
jgi:hypothetical protein